jgi:hypothetical protein
MGSVHAPPEQALCEPVPAPTIFVSGVADVAQIGGGCVCFVLYQNVPDLDPGAATMERQVVARIVIPLDAIPVAVRQTLAFVDETAMAKRAMLS